MVSFIESMRIESREIPLFDDHYARMRETAHAFNFSVPELSRRQLLKENPYPEVCVKCRIVYTDKVEEIRYIPYTVRQIEFLKIVEAPTLQYPFKFTDREVFVELLQKREEADDIVIVQQNRITDSSFTNLVFRKEGRFYTPDTYLLNGVQRRRLIGENKIIPASISISDLRQFDSVWMINAMMDLAHAIRLPIDAVIR